ncbi:MAG: hypothetical protein C0617_01930 [Desulfuromonas sp.]|nr:MAG: hypothetical protein C0617_01930 [Desulfuromonas sp.]
MNVATLTDRFCFVEERGYMILLHGRRRTMKVKVNGTLMAFDDFGSGPAVMMLHDFPFNRDMWRWQAKTLANAGYRVIVPDLPGFGESGAPLGPYTLSSMVDDLVGLLKYLGIGRSVFLGLGMGGHLVFDLLKRHPRKVAAAGFIATTPHAASQEERLLRDGQLELLRQEGPKALIEDIWQKIDRQNGRAGSSSALLSLRASMEAADPVGLSSALIALRDRRDFADYAGRLLLPTLVVGRDADQAGLRDKNRLLKSVPPKCEKHFFSESGQFVHLENPSEFHSVLVGFLDSLGNCRQRPEVLSKVA